MLHCTCATIFMQSMSVWCTVINLLLVFTSPVHETELIDIVITTACLHDDLVLFIEYAVFYLSSKVFIVQYTILFDSLLPQ